jgi:glutamyl-tRNA reductase
MATNLQKHLAKEGYPPLIVWNRTASRADPLTPLGALVASSVENAVSKSDIVFSCVHLLLWFERGAVVNGVVVKRRCGPGDVREDYDVGYCGKGVL